jgi:hypothetical protein
VSQVTAAGNIDAPIAPVALINILRETLAMILRRNCRLLAGGRLPAKNPGSLLWIAVVSDSHADDKRTSLPSAGDTTAVDYLQSAACCNSIGTRNRN